MNVLSLFDGMSCGQIALKELGVKIDNYFASEIDKFAIKQTQLNFPSTIQLGDVAKLSVRDLPKIDLLIGGSPCQGFSFAGKQLNFDDPRSKLFFEYIRILKECRDKNSNILFLLENVRMKREYEAIISDCLGIKPVIINSSLVSAQNRVRLYWSNIKTRVAEDKEVYTDIPQPQDRGLVLKDILEDNVEQRYFMNPNALEGLIKHKERNKNNGNGFGIDIRMVEQKNQTVAVGGKGMYDLVQIVQKPRGYNNGGIFKDKSPTVTSCSWEQNNVLLISSPRAIIRNAETDSECSRKTSVIRRLTPTECARLQTIPSWYKWECSNTQKYKLLGNGWTVDVIKHIFSFIDFSKYEKEKQ